MQNIELNSEYIPCSDITLRTSCRCHISFGLITVHIWATPCFFRSGKTETNTDRLLYAIMFVSQKNNSQTFLSCQFIVLLV